MLARDRCGEDPDVARAAVTQGGDGGRGVLTGADDQHRCL